MMKPRDEFMKNVFSRFKRVLFIVLEVHKLDDRNNFYET